MTLNLDGIHVESAGAGTFAAKLTIEQLIDIKHPTNALWSPDGKHVVFTWDRAGISNLYVASADGHGQPVSLTSFSEGQVDPAFWSRDSQTVYFPHGGDLWQAVIGGGAAKPAWTTVARESDIVPSPDVTRVAFVRHDDLTRIDMGYAHPAMLEMVGDDKARKTLAKAPDGVNGTRRQLAEDGQTLDQRAQLLEMLVDGAFHAGLAEVEIAEVQQIRDCLVALAADREMRNFEQLVGSLSHGGYNHHGLALNSRRHNSSNALDGGRRFNGRAAELHDDHLSRAILPNTLVPR